MSQTRQSSAALSSAAFLSGTTGVLYETLYPHVLTTLIGGSVYVVSATLITFLVAIGIGSLIAVRMVRWLWLTEALLGAVALIIGWFFIFDIEALLPLGAYIPYHPVARVAVACFLMTPPALLTGISIPAFSVLLERRTDKSGEQLTWVYALYNLGAMAAILASEYIVIRQFGIGQALMFFGVLDGLVAWIAWQARHRVPRRKAQSTHSPFWNARPVWIVGLLGIVSGAFQMEAINLVNLSFGPTADVLAAVVALALGGIGLGSLIVRYCGLRLVTVASGMALTLIVPYLAWPWVLGNSMDFLASIHSFNGPGKLVFMMALLGPFFVLAGASVPAAASALWPHESASNDYGKLLMVAAFGNATGFILFLALITWGMTDDDLVIGMTLILCGCAAWARPALASKRKGFVAALLGGSLIGIAAMFSPVLAAHELPTRLYSATRDTQIQQVDLFSRMGTRAGVFSRYDGATKLVLNGYASMTMVPLSFGPAEAFMVGLTGAATSRHHDNALVVGAASGMTASVATRLYNHVDLLDLDPNTPAILDRFKSVNDNVLAQKNLEFTATDALALLVYTDQAFDLISVTPTSPAVSGTETVYSREFMRVAQQRLAPGGVFTLVMGTVDSVPGMATLWRTLGSVFPYTGWYRLEDGFVAIVGANHPLRWQPPANTENRLTGVQRYLLHMFVLRFGWQHLNTPLRGAASQWFTPKKAAANGPVNTLNAPILQSQALVSWWPITGTTEDDIAQSKRWLADRVL